MIYKTRLSPSHPILKAHKVFGSGVLPGVVYIDLIARTLKLDQFSLEQVQYYQALSIQSTTTLVIEHQPSERWIEIYHIQDHEKCIHFRANLSDLITPSYLASTHNLSAYKNFEDIYQLASSQGITHGPFMKVAGNTQINADVISMDITLSEAGYQYHDSFILHPALLDGSSFAVAALYFEKVISSKKGAIFLPISIDKVVVHQATQGRKLSVRAKRKHTGNDELIRADIEAFNSKGDCVFGFYGLTNRLTETLAPSEKTKTMCIDINQSADVKEGVTVVLSQLLSPELLAASHTVPFFDLGLDSAELMQAAQQLEKTLAVELYPTFLFEHNTFDALCLALQPLVEAVDVTPSVEVETCQLYIPQITVSEQDELVNTLDLRSYFTLEEVLLKLKEQLSNHSTGSLNLLVTEGLQQPINAWWRCVMKESPRTKINVISPKISFRRLDRRIKFDGKMFKPGQRYLIIGGAQGLGGHLAQYLKQCGCDTVLTYHRHQPHQSDFQTVPLDVLNILQLKQFAETMGLFDGAFFLAAQADDQHFANHSAQSIADNLRVKTLGLDNVYQTLARIIDGPLVLFSSISARIGVSGQSLYACANASMIEKALAKETLRLQGKTNARLIAIDWPYWADGGMVIDNKQLKHYRQVGRFEPLSLEQGWELLEEAIRLSLPAVTVANDHLLTQAGYSLGQMAARPHSEDTLPAITGLSFSFPDADCLETFWHNLAKGHCSITKRARPWPDKTYPYGAYLKGIGQFAPLDFSVSPLDAAIISPAERLVLMHARAALEDAKVDAELRVGVIVAYMVDDYDAYGIEHSVAKQKKPQSISASLANRISYHLNLKGPSLSVNSMCSSSLLALELALQYLDNRSADVMLVAAVNLNCHPYKLEALTEKNFFSPSGLSQPFNQHADGYIPGEGVAAMVIQPLSQSQAEKAQAYASLVGIASGHGGQGNGYSVPQAAAQEEVIIQALQKAQLDIDDISVIEAHGTGTALGDPIEWQSLHQVFGQRKSPLPCASLKANIGHLEAAAGMASIIKMIAQFQYQAVAPSIHAMPLNKQLCDSDALTINTQLIEANLSYGGVSSFGAGGTNAHCILKNLKNHPRNSAKLHWNLKEYLIPQAEPYLSIKTPEILNFSCFALTKEIQDSKIIAASVVHEDDTNTEWLEVPEDIERLPLIIDKMLSAISFSPKKRFNLMGQQLSHVLSLSSAMLSHDTLRHNLGQCLVTDRAEVTKQDFSKAAHSPVRINFLTNHQLVISDVILHSTEFLPYKSIVILGGLGYLGSYCVRACLQLGVEKIVVIGRTNVDSVRVHDLLSLGRNIEYISHDFNQPFDNLISVDCVIDALGEKRETKEPQSHIHRHKAALINRSGASRCYLCSSLSTLIGLPQAMYYGSSHGYLATLLTLEISVLYLPLIQDTPMQMEHSRLLEAQNIMGLEVMDGRDFEVLFKLCLSFPAGHFIPFKGDKALYQGFLERIILSNDRAQFHIENQPNVLTSHRVLLEIAEGLGITIDEVDTSKSLTQLGYDSLALTTLAERLQSLGSQAITPVDFYEFPTVQGFLNAFRAVEMIEERSSFPALQEPVPTPIISIVAYDGCFAGAKDVEDYWQLIINGKSAFTPLSTRFKDSQSQHKLGLIQQDLSLFDGDYFDFHSQTEVEQTCPQQRWLLMIAERLIHRCGLSKDKLAGDSVGVFVGIQFDDYANLIAKQAGRSLYQITGCGKNFASNRISYYYDLTGPSETIDTACASSFSALHHAQRAIENGDCEAAFVLAASLLLDETTFDLAQQLQVFSADSQCRPFDTNANGYVKGESVAGVLLANPQFMQKHHLSSQADLLAIASGHGGRTQSLMAPNAKRQQQVLERAMHQAQLSVDELDYIEAHATATKLGDPIEVQGIKNAFTERLQPLVIGSVKANIGHTEPVSGLAGLIKSILMLREQKIPPQVNLQQNNPYLQLEQSNIAILRQSQVVKLQNIGISSFGFGGSYTHCIIGKAHPSHVQKKQVNIPWNLRPYWFKTQEIINSTEPLNHTYQIQWSPAAIEYQNIQREQVVFIVDELQYLMLSKLLPAKILPLLRRTSDHIENDCKMAIFLSGFCGEEALDTSHQVMLTALINYTRQTRSHEIRMVTCQTFKPCNSVGLACHALMASWVKENTQVKASCLDVSQWQDLLLVQYLKLPTTGEIFRWDGGSLYRRVFEALSLRAPLQSTFSNKVMVLIGATGSVASQLDAEILKQQPKALIRCARRGGVEFILDVLNPEQVLSVLSQVMVEYQRIDQILFFAADYKESAIESMDAHEFKKQQAVKCNGLSNVINSLETLQTKPLLILASSAQVMFQDANRAGYTAACLQSDVLIQRYQKAKIIHWGFWQQKDESNNQKMQALGVIPTTAQSGIQALSALINGDIQEMTYLPLKSSIQDLLPLASTHEEESYQRFKAFNTALHWLEHYCFGLFQSEQYLPALSSGYQNYWQSINDKLSAFDGEFSPSSLLETRVILQSLYPQLEPFLNLLHIVSKQWREVLSGKKTAQQVFFPEGSSRLVDGIYQANPLSDYFNQLISKTVQHSIEDTPSTHIVELGAGTGSTARAVLNKMKSVNYILSDINLSLVQKTSKTIKYAHLHTRQLNINSLSLHPMVDGIIACNVLHNADDIESTLAQINLHLKPGGQLILCEAVAESLFLALTFGLFPSWHAPKNQQHRLQGCALLNQKGWCNALYQQGFDVECVEPLQGCPQLIIIATKRLEASPQPLLRAVGKLSERRDAFDVSLPTKSDFEQTHPFTQCLERVITLTDAQSIDEQSLFSLGVDSLGAVELSNILEQTIGVKIPPNELLEFPSINHIMRSINERQQ